MNKIKTLGLFPLLVITIMITALANGCKETGPGQSVENERILIEKAINSSIGWAKDKDLSLLYGVIANDTNFLEVHPEGRVVRGIDEFRKSEAFWMSPDFQAVRYEIKDLRINISGSGTVAWWFCILDDINEWKGEPANWEDTRWTGVMEKRDGRWQIVQQHFSYGSE
ncbi:MAG: nuclear transport factor 2 family protein [Bacteroidota bacterium]|nr:nuclear transport factor 2 family protein [Bacteroidota bacterium]